MKLELRQSRPKQRHGRRKQRHKRSEMLRLVPFLMTKPEIASVNKGALSVGMPMGPIRLIDDLGLDVGERV
jgi:3-hydroxyacyl-CoA dehydrogenase